MDGTKLTKGKKCLFTAAACMLFAAQILPCPVFAAQDVIAEPDGAYDDTFDIDVFDDGNDGFEDEDGFKDPEETAQPSSGSITVKNLLKVAKDVNCTMPRDFIEDMENTSKKSISVSTFKKYVEKYNLPSEYVQRFFKDRIVLKGGNGMEYIPIDSSLPKSSYDWDSFVQSGGEMKYKVDGVSKALKGIDVSHYQGDINWKKVKADGVRFAFIRVGYRGYSTGKLMIDPYFEKNIKGATAAGIPVGVYFFSQAVNTREAREEAELTLEYIEDYDITLPVVMDVEDGSSSTARTRNLSSKQVTSNIQAFCSTVKEAGYRPMIYSNSNWFIKKMDMSKLKNYDKWLAQYYKEPFFPYKFQIWQYTGKGRVDGIKGNVDMNLCFVDYTK